MSSIDSAIASLVSRLETVTARLESVEKQLASGGGAPAASASGSEAASSASVQEYEALIDQYIKNFVELSKKLGAPEVVQIAEATLQAVNAQRDFLKVAAACKKPADNVLQNLLKPTTDAVNAVVKIKESNRTSKNPNHLSAVSEGIPALGWVLVSPTPGPHVGDMRGGSEFYSNRILKDFKGKDQTQVDWATAFNTFLKELQAYIKKYHTTGVTWNPRGEDAASFAGSSSSSTSSGSAVPPPPGPAPPPPPAVDTSGSAKNSGPDMNNVFAALNKGESVTSGLKKVTDDMKTKNRTDKTSVVPATATKSTGASAAKKAATPAKPPKFALEGNKWVVEFQVDNKNIVIDNTEAKQTVYIYKCKNSTVQIKGKVNAITFDDCTKTAVVFDTVVSSFEVVNCTSVEVQVTGKVPSFAIDKTSGCQVYISKDSLETEIVTSKSSELNVMFPHGDDLTEVAVPEQYKSFIRDGKLVTEIVHHV